MKDHTQKLLEKASRAIHAAKTLLKQDDAEFAIGRAYYAMFYAAEALLNEKDLRFQRHGGVHGAFGKHFIKSGLLDPKYHRWLLAAFNMRVQADYGVEAVMTTKEASRTIEQAGEFLKEARRHLEGV